jgi:hypothetical protein
MKFQFRESLKKIIQTKKFKTQPKKLKKFSFQASNFFSISCLTISSAVVLFYFKKEFKSEEMSTKKFKFQEISLEIELTEDWKITNSNNTQEFIISSTNPNEREFKSLVTFNRFQKSEEMNLEKYMKQILELAETMNSFESEIEYQHIQVEDGKTKHGFVYKNVTFLVVDKKKLINSGAQLFVFFENDSVIVFTCENEESKFKKDFLLPLVEKMRINGK